MHLHFDDHLVDPVLQSGNAAEQGKCAQERLTWGTVTSTMRRAAHPSGCARLGAGAVCSAIKCHCIWGLRVGTCTSTTILSIPSCTCIDGLRIRA